MEGHQNIKEQHLFHALDSGFGSEQGLANSNFNVRFHRQPATPARPLAPNHNKLSPARQALPSGPTPSAMESDTENILICAGLKVCLLY